MKYIEKNPIIINAFKFTGEVSSDNIDITPCKEPGECFECGQPLTKHGLIESQYIVCPNTYIIKGANGMQLMSSENFEAIYKPMCEDIEDAVFKEIL